MATRVSKIEHEYPYGHPRKVGETFEVDHGDVPVLLALGRIEPDSGEPVVGNTYQTRDMTAQRGKRAYNRKAVQ